MKIQQFDNAISAHLNWIKRFENAISGTDSTPIHIEQLRDDTACEFGRWLHANPTVLSDTDLYDNIKNLHRTFHADAAVIALMIQSDRHDQSIEAKITELKDVSGLLIDAIYEGKHLEAEREFNTK